MLCTFRKSEILCGLNLIGHSIKIIIEDILNNEDCKRIVFLIVRTTNTTLQFLSDAFSELRSPVALSVSDGQTN
jgi:hypothetical protein